MQQRGNTVRRVTFLQKVVTQDTLWTSSHRQLRRSPVTLFCLHFVHISARMLEVFDYKPNVAVPLPKTMGAVSNSVAHRSSRRRKKHSKEDIAHLFGDDSVSL